MGNSPNATACLRGWLGQKNMFGIWTDSNRLECGCVIFQSWYHHHNIFLSQKASVKVEAAAAWRSLCMWWRSLRRACSNECSNTPTFWRKTSFMLSFEIFIMTSSSLLVQILIPLYSHPDIHADDLSLDPGQRLANTHQRRPVRHRTSWDIFISISIALNINNTTTIFLHRRQCCRHHHHNPR